MNIIEVNTLPALREVLQVPNAQSNELFRQLVMEPLRPTWEPMLAYMPHDQGDPALSAARIMNLYLPDMGAEQGLQAIAQLQEAQVFRHNRTALAEAIEALKPQQNGIPMPTIHLSLALMNPHGPIKEG